VTHRTRIGHTLAVLATAAILAGCSNNNPTKPKPAPAPQFNRSTPENTLLYLAHVYSSRDTVAIRSLYDFTYMGESRDLNDPPASQLLTFSYADEVEHVVALRKKPTITDVVLTFGGTLVRLGSDDVSHPEWAKIQIPGNNIRLEIIDAVDTHSLSSPGITEAFSFAPTTPDSTSATDTTWKIVRWSEVQQVGP